MKELAGGIPCKRFCQGICKELAPQNERKAGQDEAKMSQDEAKIGQDAAKMAKIEPYGGTLEPTWSEDRAKICRFPPKKATERIDKIAVPLIFWGGCLPIRI